jgi:hypothetical protein
MSPQDKTIVQFSMLMELLIITWGTVFRYIREADHQLIGQCLRQDIKHNGRGTWSLALREKHRLRG